VNVTIDGAESCKTAKPSARIYRPIFRENKPKTGSINSGTGFFYHKSVLWNNTSKFSDLQPILYSRHINGNAVQILIEVYCSMI
jgi:hypothetical protein